jgi:hypothetical protein
MGTWKSPAPDPWFKAKKESLCELIRRQLGLR